MQKKLNDIMSIIHHECETCYLRENCLEEKCSFFKIERKVDELYEFCGKKTS